MGDGLDSVLGVQTAGLDATPNSHSQDQYSFSGLSILPLPLAAKQLKNDYGHT